MKKALCVALFAIVHTPGASVFGDEYHNVNGFFGERAAGLGGAFSAVADDPSGAFYNPAGLAFAYDNYISLSASSYRESKKTYENVFGPGQSYSRTSRSYLPNFFGAVKAFGETKFGFSIVSPTTDNFDQADQIRYPVSLDRVDSFRNDYTETNTRLLVGPSLARAYGKGFAFGGTLYYLYDSVRITSSQLVTRKNNTYQSSEITDRRRTMGLLPVLGMQYMPSDALSLGLTVRRPIVTAESRRKAGVVNDTAKGTQGLVFLESTAKSSAAATGGSAIAGPPESGSIPEAPEIRLGAAFFRTRYLMVSFDVIHTEGFKRMRNGTQADVNGNIYLNGREWEYLSRESTTDFAAGIEYYLTDNLALRAGAYTSRANTPEIHWADRALAAGMQINGRDKIQGPSSLSNVYYNIPAAQPMERFEHVDLRGYSIGLSWGDARSTLSITYTLEVGRGAAQIDASQPPQPLNVRSSSIYLVASIRT